MKVISLTGITCDHKKEMLILTMHFKYFRKVFKYKYVSFLDVKYNYKYF